MGNLCRLLSIKPPVHPKRSIPVFYCLRTMLSPHGPNWTQALRQAERMVAEQAGETGARHPAVQQRAGREPTPAETGTWLQQAEQQELESSSLLQGAP